MKKILLTLLFLLIGASCFATSYEFIAHITTSSRHDSTWYVFYRDGVYNDSSRAVADTTIDLDDDYDWVIWEHNWWDGIYDGFVEYPPMYFLKTNSISGTGPITWTVISGKENALIANSSIEGVTVYIKNTSTGVWKGPQISDGTGSTTWKVAAADYLVYQRLTGYNFDDSTFTVSTTAQDTAFGTLALIAAAPGSHVTAVSIFVIDNEGNAESGVRVSASLSGSNLVDSSGYAIQTVILRDTTNASGYVTFNCLSSDWIVTNPDWIFNIQSNGIRFRANIHDVGSITLDINDYR